MNLGRFVDAIFYLSELDKEHKIQSLLSDLSGHLNNIASNPVEPSYQTAYTQSLDKLESEINRLSKRLEPWIRSALQEIHGIKFFPPTLYNEIKELVSQNPASLSVASIGVTKLVKQRSTFMAHISSVNDVASAFDLYDYELQHGDAEIGFLLPRDLFENKLPNLIKELGVVNSIIRVFSELSIGSVENVEVRDISTSNPIFFFSIDPQVIAMVGVAITWALNTWKQIEDIRKIRADTAKLQETQTKPEIEAMFERMIRETIEKKTKEYIDDVMSRHTIQETRKNELTTHLNWALEALLSRIERGMIIEIRHLPPPAEADENGAKKPPPQAFQDIENSIPKLVFPHIEGSPVLRLPPTEPPQQESSKPQDKSTKRN